SSVTSPSTVSSNRLPWRTWVNCPSPIRPRAPATAWPWGSRISGFGMTSTITVPMAVCSRCARCAGWGATARLRADPMRPERAPGQRLERLEVAGPGELDDLGRQRGRRLAAGPVPAALRRGQPVAQDLLVVGGLGPAGLPLRGPPE